MLLLLIHREAFPLPFSRAGSTASSVLSLYSCAAVEPLPGGRHVKRVTGRSGRDGSAPLWPFSCCGVKRGRRAAGGWLASKPRTHTVTQHWRVLQSRCYQWHFLFLQLFHLWARLALFCGAAGTVVTETCCFPTFNLTLPGSFWELLSPPPAATKH